MITLLHVYNDIYHEVTMSDKVHNSSIKKYQNSTYAISLELSRMGGLGPQPHIVHRGPGRSHNKHLDKFIITRFISRDGQVEQHNSTGVMIIVHMC